MQLASMKNEEKLINNILFIYILGVAVSLLDICDDLSKRRCA